MFNNNNLTNQQQIKHMECILDPLRVRFHPKSFVSNPCIDIWFVMKYANEALSICFPQEVQLQP